MSEAPHEVTTNREQIRHNRTSRRNDLLPMAENKPTVPYTCNMIGIANDIILQVNSERLFSLHKFPLYSKTDFFRLRERDPLNSLSRAGMTHIRLEQFPGGSDTFSEVVNFCYGLPVNITPYNAGSLFCAALYLDMVPSPESTPEASPGTSPETFLEFVDSHLDIMLQNQDDCLTILESCQEDSCLQHATQSGLIHRCLSSLSMAAMEQQEVLTKIPPSVLLQLLTHFKTCGISDVECCQIAEKYLGGPGSPPEMSDSYFEPLIDHILQLDGHHPPLLFKILSMAAKRNISHTLIKRLCSCLAPHLGQGATLEDIRCLRPDQVADLLEEFTTLNNIVDLASVGCLTDDYLKEISDAEPQVDMSTMQRLVSALPEHARVSHDSLYTVLLVYISAMAVDSQVDAVERLARALVPSKLSEDVLEAAAGEVKWPTWFIADVLRAQNELYLRKVAAAERTNDVLAGRIADLEARLAVAHDKIADLEKRSCAADESLTSLCGDLRNELNRLNDSLKNKRSSGRKFPLF